MRRVYFSIPIFLLVSALPVPGQEVLRGAVWVEVEPAYARYIEESKPPDPSSVRRAALEEAAMVYSAMIYGWSFEYEIGEKARGIPEVFELTPLGAIPFGDPGLTATDAEFREMRLYLWTDYRMTEAQMRRMRMWRAGTVRNVQALGKGPLGGPVAKEDQLAFKRAALEDAARSGVRDMLRGMERNRPKEARGYLSLAEFPVYWMDSGYWTVRARFRVELTGLQPFAAY
ncbi:MAG: hypothetical protein LBE17_04215 [Treponema sp.]|jgi:hypothetical protein|nr:hypothetical protein [Treponema sp.]